MSQLHESRRAPRIRLCSVPAGNIGWAGWLSDIGTEMSRNDALKEISELSTPLYELSDLDPLLDRIGSCRYVLIGEASHGTADFYEWRAELSRRLIAERGFSFVAVEGDWPDCFRVNQWVKGYDGDASVHEVLGGFQRWPTWMWGNSEVAEFIEWLRNYNQRTGSGVGFYGLDVYSLWESLGRIVDYLGEKRPDALEKAMTAFRCFEPYGEDPQRYAWATKMLPDDCEDEVIDVLLEVHRRDERSSGDGEEVELDVRQNAEVLAGAERYYRTMVRADGTSWNVRDLHMVDTLDRLMKHHGDGAKAIVWEHNTHIGDARATDMASAGMINVGQEVRQRHGEDDVVLVGFGSHSGSVIAARSWGEQMQSFPVPPAPAETHEDLLHEAAPEQCLLVFPERRDGPWMSGRRGHRAIGVVYNPERDHLGNWVPTVMGLRYDAFIYLDRTEALHPLAPVAIEEAVPETYPWGT